MTHDEVKKFAEALVRSGGACYIARYEVFGAENKARCLECEFYCQVSGEDTRVVTAFEKAKRWLLDLEVRNIIEGE